MRIMVVIEVVIGLGLVLSGCGGMNRAVGVLPTTLDQLARQTQPLRCGGLGEGPCP